MVYIHRYFYITLFTFKLELGIETKNRDRNLADNATCHFDCYTYTSDGHPQMHQDTGTGGHTFAVGVVY